MTAQENKVLELSMQWRQAKFAVEEALIRQELTRAIDMLIKERRDAQAERGSPETRKT
ncbi:MAG: hypothetical protein H0V18_07785 [Pyrinomonadaceae bacterium]|nr:hypothetical protein [Pyrinomonadaceae bacterium]